MTFLHKRVAGLALLLAGLLPVGASAQAPRAYHVTIDGTPVSFTGTPPTMMRGSILVPLRGVFEAMSATVKFNNSTKTVFAQRGATSIVLPVGATVASVNGKAEPLAQPAQIVGGSTLVPLRFVAESLGAVVTWHPESSTVVIQTASAPLPGSAPVVINPVLPPAPAPPVTANGNGDFRVESRGGQWRFVDSAGQAFFLRGVHGVRFQGTKSVNGRMAYAETTTAKYGDPQTWAAATAAKLRSWGFNTIGANSDSIMFKQGLPYTILLDMSAAKEDKDKNFPDVYDPTWVDTLLAVAAKQCAPHQGDPNLIGYFTDNELHWAGNYRTKENLLQVYLDLPPQAPGHQAAMNYVADHNLNPSHLNYHDADGFQRQVATRYFQMTHDAIKQYDPNHLILGCRFSRTAYDSVLQGMGNNLDVVSLNDYDPAPPTTLITHITEVTHHPVIISEFSFKALDSGLPNTKGAGTAVATQAERGALAAGYVSQLVDTPSCVGYIWYKYTDDPPDGSDIGENNNYGLVSNADTPWTAVVQRLTSVNHRAATVRATDLYDR